MQKVISKDGTSIAYEKRGSGPPLLLIDGAFCSRSFGPMPDLAKALSDRFTVVHYDRRGRGDSGDASAGDLAHVVDREIEDVDALVAALGGEACVYGISSGAMLALRAVAAGRFKATRLALYEAPLSLDGTNHPQPADWIEQIHGFVKNGQRGDAVKLFMRVVGTPRFAIFMMSNLMPKVWKNLCAVAHTLPHDFALLGDTQRGGPVPQELVTTMARVRTPTLVLSGGKSPPYMKHTAEVLAKGVVDGTSAVVPGQDHNVSAKAMAPVLAEFFGGAGAAAVRTAA